MSGNGKPIDAEFEEISPRTAYPPWMSDDEVLASHNRAGTIQQLSYWLVGIPAAVIVAVVLPHIHRFLFTLFAGPS